MKKIVRGILLLLCLCTSYLYAQVPQKMSYQAVLRNGSNALIVNTTVGMQISILEGSETGTPAYIETHQAKTNANGLVTLAIGTGAPVKGVFTDIKWGSNAYFVKTETDPAGGTNYTITGISQLMSVPYAFFAGNSGASNGTAGKSAFEIWKEMPGNSTKTEAEFFDFLKGPKGDKGTTGKSAFEVWKEIPGNENKTETNYLEALRGPKGDQGRSAYETWQTIPGNENKTLAEYQDAIKTATGKSAYDVWKELAGNSNKTMNDYIASLKGADGRSAFEVWKAIPGNENKSLNDYQTAIKGEAGKSAFDLWKEIPGNETKNLADYQAAIKGSAGKSAFDLWKEQPGNETKTLADYQSAIKGIPGKSAFEEWQSIPGNETKTLADYQASLVGATGKSAFELWQTIPGNETKTLSDYQESLKGADGKSAFDVWKDQPGNESKTLTDYQTANRGASGKSAFDLWKDAPGNENKTLSDFQASLKGADGKSAFDVWKEQPGNENKTLTDYQTFIKGETGKSGFDLWKEMPGNETKTLADYQASLIGATGKSAFELWQTIPGNETKTLTDYQASLAGATGKSAFEIWKELPGNENKTLSDYLDAIKGAPGKTIFNGITDPTSAIGVEGDFYINTDAQKLFGPKQADDSWPAPTSLKGSDGVGVDFKGSFTDLAAFEDAGNTASLNKAYYNTTDKKSYIYDGTEWKVFASDGAGGGLSGFNVDRPITRQGLPVSNLNLGAGGKTVAEFLEAVFFPALAATPPTTTFTTTTTTFPYVTWKTWVGYTKNVDFNWSLTNQSKLDATDDKNISSIRLLNGATELQTVTPVNTGTSQSGTFTNIAFTNPAGSKTADFSQTYTLEVKDAQPNTVNKTLTLTMQRAVQLSYGAPSLTPGTTTYEYSPTDIPLTLGWNITRGDETIADIKVNGTSTGSTAATGTTPVVFKSPNNGGAASQSFTLQATGDIYGAAGVQTSATVKWESTLYRGAISSPGVSPCDAGFSFTDAQVKALTTKQLGGSWKGTTGYDFVCDAAGQYAMFAYPDDGSTPSVQYFDANFNVWQTYPANQVKIIDRTGFMNASGYNGKNYKLVFVCVEYKNVTVKIRIQ